jgi:hypothetical protein
VKKKAALWRGVRKPVVKAVPRSLEREGREISVIEEETIEIMITSIEELVKTCHHRKAKTK